MQAPVRHQCVIYDGSPATHLGGLSGLIERKLKKNIRCLYLNSPNMVAGIRTYLSARGVTIEEEVERGALVLTSDLSHLTDRRFDVDKMIGLLSAAVDQALTDGFDGLWATGDMTWEFGGEKNFSKLLEYECRLEELFGQQPALSGVCQYHTQTLPLEAIRDALYTHEAVYFSETLSRINPNFAARHGKPPATPPVSEAELKVMFERVYQAAAS